MAAGCVDAWLVQELVADGAVPILALDRGALLALLLLPFLLLICLLLGPLLRLMVALLLLSALLLLLLLTAVWQLLLSCSRTLAALHGRRWLSGLMQVCNLSALVGYAHK